jgi:uncharacterized protein
MSIAEHIAQVTPIDHHCHGVVRDGLTFPLFTSLLTEGDTAHPGEEFNSPLGLAVRARCAPLLGLERHAPADEYWATRAAMSNADVSRTFFLASGIGRYVVDTGYRGSELTTPSELAAWAQRPADAILRLETLAEEIIGETTADQFVDAYRAALAERTPAHVGYKSIIAYRYGLDFDPTRPTDAEVERACQQWIDEIERTGVVRVHDVVLLRFFLWEAVQKRKPIQIHIGYGDADITLYRCDPSQMTPFLRAIEGSGATITLLHCYPFIREAAILCQVFSHVYMDTSLGVVHTGAGSTSLVRESLEIAPFSRLLFATDAFGLAELYFLGTHFWRAGMTTVFSEWLAADALSEKDAQTIVDDIAWRNAARLYGIPGEE